MLASEGNPPSQPSTKAETSRESEKQKDATQAIAEDGSHPLAGSLRHFEAHSFSHGERQLHYRWMQPNEFDPDAKEKYPLVVFLHGAGERGDDNESQLKHGAKELASDERRIAFPAFALFPQCPKDLRWVETDWSAREGSGTFSETPSRTLSLTLKLVDEILDGKLHSAPIDRDRVYITGLSMGGYGTWHATALRPDLFAASAPVCGGGDPKLVPLYSPTLPIWAFHGDADSVVPLQRGREIVDALNNAGHRPAVKFTVYPGVNHNSWTPTYAKDELYEWIFAQRRTAEQRRTEQQHPEKPSAESR